MSESMAFELVNSIGPSTYFDNVDADNASGKSSPLVTTTVFTLLNPFLAISKDVLYLSEPE